MKQKISLKSLNKRFMDFGTLLDDSSDTCKFHWMNQNDLENYKVNSTPYMYCDYPQGPKL